MMSSSKKQQNTLSAEKLQKIALFYLSRYEATEKSLKDVLKRRIEKAKNNGIDVQNAENSINNIISKMKEYNYLSDERYAENKVKELFAKGKSKKIIEQKLALKGIKSETISKVLSSLDDANNYNTDFIAAVNFARKKKIGPFRKKLLENSIKKELGKMARGGFDYETSKKIVLAATESDLTCSNGSNND
ncbi:MAG: regulatory protein RecX [Alphaproteobacteria bacterium]